MSEDELRATYRILDASANRACEGLRTIEEYARFVLDHRELTGQLKSLRHDLTAALARLPRERLLSARDTTADVGTAIGEAAEYQRADQVAVITAAAARTAQSLRVLEEYGKTIDPAMAAVIEQIRYRSYTVTAQLELQATSDPRRQRLAQSSLYVLVDAGSSIEAFCQTIEQMAIAGVDVIQLRDRTRDDRTLLHRARAGGQIARRHGALFIMNDRADLALAADVDGVHVGQEELPVADARRILGPTRLIGLSTHSVNQVREAIAVGADYIGCGPVFAGRTKSFDAYVGTEFLQQVVAEATIPAFAIGGIDISNVDQVVSAGFRRIAVTGAVRDADDPAAAVAALKQRLA